MSCGEVHEDKPKIWKVRKMQFDKPLPKEGCIKVDDMRWIVALLGKVMENTGPRTIDDDPLNIHTIKPLIKITTFLLKHQREPNLDALVKNHLVSMYVQGISAAIVKFNLTTDTMPSPYNKAKKRVFQMLGTKENPQDDYGWIDYWAIAFIFTRDMRYLEKLDKYCHGSHPFKSFMNNTVVAEQYKEYLQECTEGEED